jgi:hypothetical protein
MRWRSGPFQSGDYEDPELRGAPFWPLTDGETHFLHSFIQGGIMVPESRSSLRRAWGLCERHAWGALAVELNFREKLLLGPAILYEELLDRCLASAVKSRSFRQFRYRIRPSGPCLICEMGAFHAGKGAAKDAVIRLGKQTGRVAEFAAKDEGYWKSTVCPACSTREEGILCRRHLLESDTPNDGDGLKRVVAFLGDTRERVAALGRSFLSDRDGRQLPEDRAALVTAIGWMSGWRPLLILLE